MTDTSGPISSVRGSNTLTDNKDGKRTLDEAGIKVPYQQMDVHLQKD